MAHTKRIPSQYNALLNTAHSFYFEVNLKTAMVKQDQPSQSLQLSNDLIFILHAHGDISPCILLILKILVARKALIAEVW